MAVRALIVEDEPLARDTLREFAAGVSWLDIIGEAADGKSAVRLIDESRPDLVLLDIRMPELSGLQILARIRHQPEVVFTTAHDEHAVTAFELGALEYLLKPFGRERFNLAMERVRRRLESAAAGSPTASERAAAALQTPPQAGPLERLFVRDARGLIVQLRAEDVVRLSGRRRLRRGARRRSLVPREPQPGRLRAAARPRTLPPRPPLTHRQPRPRPGHRAFGAAPHAPPLRRLARLGEPRRGAGAPGTLHLNYTPRPPLTDAPDRSPAVSARSRKTCHAGHARGVFPTREESRAKEPEVT